MNYTPKLSILTLVVGCFLFFNANAEVDNNKLSLSIAYNVCIVPDKPACFTYKEADKKKCPHCKKWGRNFLGSTHNITNIFSESKYSYDSGLKIPRANFMLQDAAKELYGVEFPKTKEGFPITINTIYQEPEKYGWVEVDKDSRKIGVLVVWPNIGGVIVRSENDDGRRQDFVLYPSHKKRGKLNMSAVEKLKKEGTPKFIVPEELISSMESGAQKELNQ